MPLKDSGKRRAYKAAWHQANKERMNERSRKYYESHKEEHYENTKAWRKAHPGYDVKYREINKDKAKERTKVWRDNNKERARIAVAEWRKSHREEIREAGRIYAQNRRARIEANGGKLSRNIVQKLWALQRGKCTACKKDLKKVGFHLDHIVPLAPRSGKPRGRHEDGNMQLTCPTCNLKKFNKDPIQFMQEMGYLL